jgi:hypothetical protein
MGILSALFKPDPRTAEIRRLRSLIKETYGKGEIISYLWELKKLDDPIAMRILEAATSNNMAEMQRLIRSL